VYRATVLVQRGMLQKRAERSSTIHAVCEDRCDFWYCMSCYRYRYRADMVRAGKFALSRRPVTTTMPDRAISIWSDDHICRYSTNNTQSLIVKYSHITNSYILLPVLPYHSTRSVILFKYSNGRKDDEMASITMIFIKKKLIGLKRQFLVQSLHRTYMTSRMKQQWNMKR
jgi:hypothetical protein